MITCPSCNSPAMTDHRAEDLADRLQVVVFELERLHPIAMPTVSESLRGLIARITGPEDKNAETAE